MPPPLFTADLATRLRDAAHAASHNSYAPYSQFHVGAAILLDEPHAGTVVTGCNVENASYRLCTCAEQTAVARAVAQFGPRIRIAAVAISNRENQPCSPCGACRQTLLEFAPDPATVTVLFPDGATSAGQQCSLADLLSSGFRLNPTVLA